MIENLKYRKIEILKAQEVERFEDRKRKDRKRKDRERKDRKRKDRKRKDRKRKDRKRKEQILQWLPSVSSFIFVLFFLFKVCFFNILLIILILFFFNNFHVITRLSIFCFTFHYFYQLNYVFPIFFLILFVLKFFF